MSEAEKTNNMGKAEKCNSLYRKSIAGSDFSSVDSASTFSKPSISPLPYPKTSYTNATSLEAPVNARLKEPVISILRPTIRVLRFAFALASGISYAIELDHRYSASNTNFIYAQVVFGLTLLTLIIDVVNIGYYWFMWAIEWTIMVLWIACFGVFYGVYLNGEVPADYAVVDFGRMKFAGWCNLVNALLWLCSALYSSVMCYLRLKAAVKGKLEDRRQKRENGSLVKDVEKMETGTVAAVQGSALE
jgi:hypothetical protein